MDKHCTKCHGKGYFYLDPISKHGRMDCDQCAAPAPKADDLQQAITQLRALEAAGEDPRNANQRWDVTPEQAGALLAHLDDVEQRHAAAVALWREVEGYKDSLRATVSITWVERMEAALAPAQEASDGK